MTSLGVPAAMLKKLHEEHALVGRLKERLSLEVMQRIHSQSRMRTALTLSVLLNVC